MKKIVILILIAVFAFIVTMVITCNRVANTVEKNTKEFPITYIKGVDSGYVRLFNADQSIHDAETTIVKGRNPISDFAYGEAYHIEISKLNCSAEGPLDSIISVSFKYTQMSMNVIYTGTFSRLPVSSSYAHRKQESSEHLYVTVSGDGVSLVSKNDSTLVYQGKLKTLGLKYFLDGPQDIYIRKEKKPYEPMRIVFARRKNATYLVMMAKETKREKYETSFDDNILK